MVFWIYLAAVGLMSLVAFATYVDDKRRAKNGDWRIRESVLIALSFFLARRAR